MQCTELSVSADSGHRTLGATGTTEFGPSLAAIPCSTEGECEAQQGAGVLSIPLWSQWPI